MVCSLGGEWRKAPERLIHRQDSRENRITGRRDNRSSMIEMAVMEDGKGEGKGKGEGEVEVR